MNKLTKAFGIGALSLASLISGCKKEKVEVDYFYSDNFDDIGKFMEENHGGLKSLGQGIDVWTKTMGPFGDIIYTKSPGEDIYVKGKDGCVFYLSSDDKAKFDGFSWHKYKTPNQQ